MAPKKGADGREKKAMNKAKAEKVKQVAMCNVNHGAWCMVRRMNIAWLPQPHAADHGVASRAGCR